MVTSNSFAASSCAISSCDIWPPASIVKNIPVAIFVACLVATALVTPPTPALTALPYPNVPRATKIDGLFSIIISARYCPVLEESAFVNLSGKYISLYSCNCLL